MEKPKGEGIFFRSLYNINRSGELILPRRSTRRFIAHIGLAALVTLGVGHNLIDRASTPLENAVDKQGDKVGQKVDDMNATAAEKLQSLSDYAETMYIGVLKVTCYLKDIGADFDVSTKDCAKVNHHNHRATPPTTVEPSDGQDNLPGIQALIDPNSHNP